MKKSKVKELLAGMQVQMVDELDETTEDIRTLIETHTEDFDYGYRVGMSRAAIIVMARREKLFPEDFVDEDPEE